MNWDPQWLYEVMSGRRRGVSASALRAALSVFEPAYFLGVQWRNRRFDSGRREATRVGVPVVSVGNITTGGTGKTPVVEWVARRLREWQRHVVIISRGYGAEAGTQNDEAIELEQSLPDVPHLQNPNRVEAARAAIQQYGCQCILLDDGFQHRRLARDLDIVLLDALEPFGFHHLLPRGILREPLANLARADWVGLSRANLIEDAKRQEIREQVARFAPRAHWFEVSHEPMHWENDAGDCLPVGELLDRPLFAFCGIGNPNGFRRTLDQLGLDVQDLRVFPDHHTYGRQDVDSLADWVRGTPDATLVCTRKDLVKLRVDRIGSALVWSLRIGISFQVGEDELERELRRVTSNTS
jgi:tetraacyldisaccharide 4'-kinase